MRLLREPWPLLTMYHIISSGMDTSVSVLPYCTAAVHSPAPNLRIERRGRGMRFGVCDGCDDCDGIFDTDPTVILIVTTVTNRHTSCFRSRIALPFLVRFTVYSTPYSLSSSPAFTLSCRVRILGCISS